VGLFVHTLFANPDKYLDTYVVEAEFLGPTLKGEMSKTSKAAKEARAAWWAELKPDATVVQPEDLTMIKMLSDRINESKEVKGLLRGSTRESSIFTTDPETQAPIACRPDLIGRMGHNIDFKTTIDAT